MAASSVRRNKHVLGSWLHEASSFNLSLLAFLQNHRLWGLPKPLSEQPSAVRYRADEVRHGNQMRLTVFVGGRPGKCSHIAGRLVCLEDGADAQAPEQRARLVNPSRTEPRSPHYAEIIEYMGSKRTPRPAGSSGAPDQPLALGKPGENKGLLEYNTLTWTRKRAEPSFTLAGFPSDHGARHIKHHLGKPSWRNPIPPL